MTEEKKKVKDIEEYYVLLAEVETLWDSEMGTPEGHRLEELAEMLDAFEKDMFPLGNEPRRSGGRF